MLTSQRPQLVGGATDVPYIFRPVGNSATGWTPTARISPRPWPVSCRAAQWATSRGGDPETTHVRCPGCGRLLIIVWTDTALLVPSPSGPGERAPKGRASPARTG